MLADPCRLAHQNLILDRAPDEAPVCSLFAVQALRQQRKAARTRIADEARQEPCSAGIRNQPDTRKGLDEARFQAGNHDVAGERDVGSGAGGNAVHRRYDREGQGTQLAYQRIVMLLE